MAFQRPFLISLKRGDTRHPWGFKIFGGKEYGEPHVVQSVAEDSVAERCGLRDGDEVIQVGRVNIQDLNLAQVQELLARCGNKIEMFVIREDPLAPRKGKEPPSVKAVVHNPYNSPLQLYSTENIAETLAKQTEVLTEGIVSTDEEEGPENLSFKQKSAVFQLLEEQSRQDSPPQSHSQAIPQSTAVRKPTAAPPPPPKPKPPSNEHLFNGEEHTFTQRYSSPVQSQQENQRRVEYQTTTERVVSQYQYQQEPVQKQTRVYQVTSQTGYQPAQGQQALNQSSYQQVQSNQQLKQGQQSVHQQHQSYQPLNQSNYRSPQGPLSPAQGHQSPVSNFQPSQGYQSPTSNYPQGYQSPQYQQQQAQQQYLQQQNLQQQQRLQQQQHQQQLQQQQQEQQQQQKLQQQKQQQLQQQQQKQQQQQQQQRAYQSQHQENIYQSQKPPSAVSNAEFKIGPPPPPRASSTQKQNTDNMTAIYRQQYEQHLQQQQQQQQYYDMQNNYNDYDGQDGSRQKPTAHIITENIFENNSMSGTPITYKAPPAAPPKPAWPPTNPQSNEQGRQTPTPPSPSGLRANMGSAWPPKQPSVRDLPKTGFNPAAVREQSTGRRCVWPPPKAEDENRSGRNTPQSPMSGRRIQWNPSPSPPLNRRIPFASSSPSRRKDIAWPPPCPQVTNIPKDRPSPRLSRKARFDDYIKEHASNNVPTTYRAPPGTQHVEFC